MPELPEVETIRLSLSKHLIGKKISDVEVLSAKQFIGDKKKVINSIIVTVDRKGKVISMKLDNHCYLNFHLKMTGEMLFVKNKNQSTLKYQLPRTGTNQLPNKHTRLIIYFTDNSVLYFNDLRKFGWLKVSDKPETPPAHDILSSEFTEEYLKQIASKTNKPIKLLLMDQDKLAGLGNIYANDSLWQAKINPLRSSKSLKNEEIKNLYSAIKEIITEALKYKGSSASDEMYIMPDGSPGQYQYHAKVYDREDKPCLRDRAPIKRIKQTGRSTYFCPQCQI